jgi:hypothetical protein
MPGCLGQDADLACQAVLADVRPHIAVPVVMELAADIGVCKHDGLLVAGGPGGLLWPFTDRLPGGLGQAPRVTVTGDRQETHGIRLLGAGWDGRGWPAPGASGPVLAGAGVSAADVPGGPRDPGWPG